MDRSELGKLHKQLVFGRILTEDEFWATRKVDILPTGLLTYCDRRLFSILQ